MTQLEKIQKFLTFWFSPWGAAKGARWEAFTRDLPFHDVIAIRIIQMILDGYDDENLDWSVLE